MNDWGVIGDSAPTGPIDAQNCVVIGNKAGMSIEGASNCLCLGGNRDVSYLSRNGQVNIIGIKFTSEPIARVLIALTKGAFRVVGIFRR